MFRSIRWTLQLWHAVLLLAVVCIFGGTLYYSLSHARFQGIDAELRGMAEVLAARLRPGPPPRPWREGGPETRPWDRGGFSDPPPRRIDGPDHHQRDDALRELPPWERRAPETRPFAPAGQRPRFKDDRRGPPGPPPEVIDEMQRRLEVPDDLLRRYAGDADNAPYFIIWRSNGELLQSSRNLPEVASPGPRAPNDPFPPPQYRQRGEFREVIVPGALGVQVAVGRSIRRELKELRQLLWLLGITGGGVMAIGLLGGWLLSARAIRPIKTITSTAQNISASNLSRRISLIETENELGSLAAVLNAMFARLEAAFERQIRFTADASHELRTPLSIIYSHAELALARDRSAEEYRKSIETCFRASKRMKSLVDSLLVLARADAGKLEIRREELDLSESAEDCLELVRPLAAEKKIQLKSELQSARICGDTFRLAQVITNLLTNAINYNREGGSVTVGVKADGGQAILTVSDTGVGIAQEDQKHLFERFYRVDKARSRELGGSGLGLAICRSIVEAHGGRISLASEPGKGTTITASLPTA